MIRLIASLILTLSLNVLADGNLGFSVHTEKGFWRGDIIEKDGIRSGVLSAPGVRIPTAAYIENGRLLLPIGSTSDGLDVKFQDEGQSTYQGELYGLPASVSFERDLSAGTMTAKGEIGQKIRFKYQTKIDKKGKKSARFDWFDLGLEVTTWYLTIEFTPEKSPGRCKGGVYTSGKEIAAFACSSSGSLSDAFFKSDIDVIAWIVHLIISPSEKP